MRHGGAQARLVAEAQPRCDGVPAAHRRVERGVVRQHTRQVAQNAAEKRTNTRGSVSRESSSTLSERG